jgi:hypothetical protein
MRQHCCRAKPSIGTRCIRLDCSCGFWTKRAAFRFWAITVARERELRMFTKVRSQIIRASGGTFRRSTVSTQLIESVPANTMANLATAGNGGS